MPGQYCAPNLGQDGIGHLFGDRPSREEVGLGVDEQPLGRAGGGVPITLGQRVDHLQHGRRERGAETECLRAGS